MGSTTKNKTVSRWQAPTASSLMRLSEREAKKGDKVSGGGSGTNGASRRVLKDVNSGASGVSGNGGNGNSSKAASATALYSAQRKMGRSNSHIVNGRSIGVVGGTEVVMNVPLL
eukprot:TRINITY_DN17458_c0_g1_i1.p1 TRINITY_DN17458_c0_g1~~TRINITY_DN17458_c0_g1_i1.p1  ORF type:complete len:114 (-),score=42.53 TRINITY_DN17458_c0_g1_i1:62-403(-)